MSKAVIVGKNYVALVDPEGNEFWRTNADECAKTRLAALSPSGKHVAVVERHFSVQSYDVSDGTVIEYVDTVLLLDASTGGFQCRQHNCDIVKAMDWRQDDAGKETLVVTHSEPIFDGPEATNKSTFCVSNGFMLRPDEERRGVLRKDLPARQFHFYSTPDAVVSKLDAVVVKGYTLVE